MRKAKRKFMKGPAAITIKRIHTDLFMKDLGPTVPSSSSSCIRQKPPKGKRRMLNSVSPIWREKIFAPMPMENSSTKIPLFFAAMKCPYSWAITRIPIKTTEMIMENKLLPPLGYRKFRHDAKPLAHVSASNKSSSV